MSILGGDIESRQTLDELVDRAKAAAAEVIANALTGIGTQGGALVDKAERAGSLLASNIMDDLQAALHKAVADVQATVAGLDGWTLDITIPPITIRLSKPK